ncbi:MAG TPA: hypothetical protein VI341_08630 [Actinomycetota bacterium]
MGRKLGIAALVAALLVAGLLVGVSQGSSGRATRGVSRGAVLQVIGGETLAEAHKGLVVQLREEMLEPDGDRIGTIRWTCINSVCTIVYGFRPTAPTGGGSIVVAGLFRGFNGERMPVTGGTDDYFNAGGEVTLSVVNDEFAHAFDLAA